jgi:L-seryl-tRNA(Ser) seleniumtransferase
MHDHSLQNLRELPPVGEILAAPAVAELIADCGRDRVREWAREALAEVRESLSTPSSNGECGRESLTARVVEAIQRRSRDDATQTLGGVINATGVILHTGLGRAPLCSQALEAIHAAAAACNLEVDLVSGERRYRGYQLQSAWERLTGAAAALVVNNNAGATILALDALCRGREVVISRGQLIEIGGSFRLPDIFSQSGAILREVGTTNRTSLADYEQAIGPQTAAILRVHPSNYRVVGFADTPATNELAILAHRYGLVCIDDIGSGCLVDTTRFGLPAEPTFPESIAAGADLVLGSGDKLLGGPQCGILLGHVELVDRLAGHPLARALRVDKLALAALSATLDAYLRGTAETEIPTLVLLAARQESLATRAERIQSQLASPPLSKGGAGGVALPTEDCQLSIEVSMDTSPVGGGSLPGAELPTAVLRIKHRHLAADELALRLRLGPPRVFGRVQENEVVLDLRSVLPQNDQQIVAALNALTSPASSGTAP